MTEHLMWIRSAVAEYERALTLYTVKILGDMSRAQDVVQDAFLKLCEQDRGAVEPRLRAWLFTVCRNRALDVRRKEKRMTPLNAATEQGHPNADPAPPEALAKEETASHVLGLLDALPDRQREAIRLKFQHGHSYREISQVMDTTVNNVGVLIHTGIKTLRTRVASQGA